MTNIEAMRPGELHYEGDELACGEGFLYGWFTGEVDWTGKLTFQESSEHGTGRVSYFFPAEIVEFTTEQERA